MKKILSSIALCALLMACNDAVTTSKTVDTTEMATRNSKDTGNATAAPVDSAAAMQAWIACMTPGSIHKMLANDNGTWNEEIRMWMAPGAAPEKMKSTCINTMILGGRYQQSRHTGIMMGMPYEGYGLTGYDNAKKKMIMTWIDNMGTGMMHLEGDYDSTAKVIHLKGTQTDPVSGKEIAVREELTYRSDGSQLMEMYGSQAPGSPEFKMLEIAFTRK